jgi:hypothetical protein
MLGFTPWSLVVTIAVGCGENDDLKADTNTDTGATGTTETDQQDGSCGHRMDAAVVNLGFNIVLDETATTQVAQGRPLQENWTLAESTAEITDHNDREYARIASYMMPIRDALMCDIATLDEAERQSLTQVLTLNNIRTEQDLSGTPPEQVYSKDGIFNLLSSGENLHPMMKYLEEAELELKCIAFEGFDFTNPKGDDHCVIHDLPVGQGLTLP